jgi:hypothetical protein
MSGKIFFKLNEKLFEGKTFEIIIDHASIGQISKNNDTMIYQAQHLKNYHIIIKGEDKQKSIDINLDDNNPEQTIEVITNKENNKFYLYLTFVILYLVVIIACYFILDVDIYYTLILMVLALPLIITKLLNNTNDTDFNLKLVK